MSNKKCPFLKKTCIGHDCALYIQVQGINPQTGNSIDTWDCAHAWLPILLIENSQQQRQTGAAVESFRNEMVEANRHSHSLQEASLKRLINGHDN